MSQGHLPPFTVMGVVFPEERHVGIGEIDESMIRDGDTVRVPGQILQDVFGTTEGSLGIDHPVFSKEGAEKGMERLFFCQRKA